MTMLLTLAALTAGLHTDKHQREPPMHDALASWYDIDGTGSCDVGSVQRGMRFASLILPCGARALFCYRRRCVTATMSDHGPYVYGRTFDLNNNLRLALRCDGVCSISWRLT